MRQEKLENRVEELFCKQGFELDKDENTFKAGKDTTDLVLKVFSSEKYSKEQIKGQVETDEKIFVDEELHDIKEELENDISVIKEDEKQKEFKTPSYELIGDIAVINDLNNVKSSEAVEGILHHNPHVETIMLKKEGLKGEFRVGEYEKLYGEKTETTHTEFDCRYRVDPTKTYFSERFSTERKRVIDQINDGEKVLVMFSGVGPFSIMAARLSNPNKVVSVEKNPEAVRFQEENISLNNVEDTVEVVEGDVKDILPNLNTFDRIIMPLPGSSQDYVDLAFKHTKKGGIVHYYRFLEERNWSIIEDEIEKASEAADREHQIVERTVCGERAAYIDRVCLDIRLK